MNGVWVLPNVKRITKTVLACTCKDHTGYKDCKMPMVKISHYFLVHYQDGDTWNCEITKEVFEDMFRNTDPKIKTCYGFH